MAGAAVLVLGFLAGGCAGDISDLDLVIEERCVECQGERCAEPLEIEFLGAAGFAIRRGADLLLTGPFFTNPGFLKTSGFQPLESDPFAIEAALPAVSDARAILVGHAHYDHLMDVPYIAEHRATAARIYASDTAAHILAAVPALEGRVESVEARAWSAGETEQWIDVPDSRIRFLALESEHAPHFYFGIKFLQGGVDEDLDSLPRRIFGWPEGQTLAYLIEFLSEDRSRVDFRIHYQDSASNPPNGFPPQATGPVDVAIPCVASHRFVESYPDAIYEQIEPAHVVMGHWEDFFRPWSSDPADLRHVALTDPRDFMVRLDTLGIGAERRSLPAPRGRVVIGGCP